MEKGGTWLGPGSHCETTPCTSTVGACCAPDGECRVKTEEDCTTYLGEFHGVGVSCSPDYCGSLARGACCASDSRCYVTTQADCYVFLEGTYLGHGTICIAGLCP